MTTPNEQSSREQDALKRIVALDPEGVRGDDLGLAVRIAREALSSPIAITAEEAGREGDAACPRCQGSGVQHFYPDAPYLDNAVECVTVYAAPSESVAVSGEVSDVAIDSAISTVWEDWEDDIDRRRELVRALTHESEKRHG